MEFLKEVNDGYDPRLILHNEDIINKLINHVQSVIFKKTKWTSHDAIRWLKDHGFKYMKIDETPHTYRFRQIEPNKNAIYRMKPLKSLGINLVIMHVNSM